MRQWQAGKQIHIVGIGGAGLSAIARVLLERGWRVSGSDIKAGPVVAALAADGARIHLGHDARHVDGADLVLATSAVNDDHIELATATLQGIPVVRRREFMRTLLEGCETIAVAGTHGKTTTTSMIVHALRRAGRDPSYIVGGTMGNSGRNAAVGSGPAFVIEADEYGDMFHGLSPRLAVVTSAEHDHPDYFKTAEDMTASFKHFVDTLRPDGKLVACADDPAALALAREYRNSAGEFSTYAIDDEFADLRATDLSFSSDLTTFKVWRKGKLLGEVGLGVPGAHNVLNALAALAVAHERGIDFETSASALADFKATKRRFEVRGVRDGVIIVDDYAHHPTEIEVNIRAARLRYPDHQIWAIWQPHTFTRVRAFWSAFIAAFHGADRILVTPIYAARETPLKGVTSEALVSEMKGRYDTRFSPSYVDAAAILRERALAPAVALIFSAGDANLIADLFLNDEA